MPARGVRITLRLKSRIKYRETGREIQGATFHSARYVSEEDVFSIIHHPWDTVVRRRILLFLLPICCVATFTTSTLSQVQVTLDASKDNTLYQDSAGALSNGAGQHIFVGRTNVGGLIRRALVAFNVAGSIPPGSQIMSVTLTLNMSQTSSGIDTVSVYRVLADWGEGTSAAFGNEGSGAPATTNDATWIHRFYNTTFWSSPGGDFVPAPSATLPVSLLGPYVWGPTNGMSADVQQWLDSPSQNFGWILVGNETAPHLAKRFDSREDTVLTSRPKLTIVYSPSATVHPGDPGPFSFALLQNYPNPFNPSTVIRFTIPDGVSAPTVLRVYDILGKEVATLVNEVMGPGSHAVTFSTQAGSVPGEKGTTLSSGVYYYQLRAGEFLETRRMMLVR